MLSKGLLDAFGAFKNFSFPVGTIPFKWSAQSCELHLDCQHCWRVCKTMLASRAGFQLYIFLSRVISQSELKAELVLDFLWTAVYTLPTVSQLFLTLRQNDFPGVMSTSNHFFLSTQGELLNF